MLMKPLRIPLRIVLYREGDAWVAHCLEFDLVGDGATQDEALRELSEAIQLQVDATLEHGNPANLFMPADGKYFEMFAAGKDVAGGELRFAPMEPVRIEEVEVREYSEAEPVLV